MHPTGARCRIVSIIAFAVCLSFVADARANTEIELQLLGRHESGIFDESAAEIGAYHAATRRMFVTNAANATLDVIDVSDPRAPALVFAIELSYFGSHANSVAIHGDVIAAAVENDDAQAPGTVVFFDPDGRVLNQLTVGSMPDMLVFSPDGRWLLVANEGEPDDDYLVDPAGSISVIHMRRGVTRLGPGDVRTAGFDDFNRARLHSSIRIFGPNATVAQDLEPEYIAISDDSRTAWVTLQENNALAVVDIQRAKVTGLLGLGYQDHMRPGNGLDANDRDGAIDIRSWPVLGMYQPDAIQAYQAPLSRKDEARGGRHETFLVMVNEGDGRDYDGYSEEARVASLPLDPIAFPDATSLQASGLGRLQVSTANGDTDGDGDYDALHAFGTRSFSIRDIYGAVVFDSGEELEQLTAAALPQAFNSDSDDNSSFDSRSDNKGPEPEALAVAPLFGRTYAFVGLERIGGVAVYDITNPRDVSFVTYVNPRDFSGDPSAGTAGDLGPEGLVVIDASASPTGEPLLVVMHEVSGTTTVYRIAKKD